jgi:RNA polymerase sigma-70 factor (ECF subfamily)
MTNNSQHTHEFLRLLGIQEDRTKAFIFSLVPNWADAQDIVQEVRLRLWEQFDNYDPSKDFGAWARTIAYYQVLAYRKRSRGSQMLLSEESLELVATVFNQGVDHFEMRLNALQRCLNKLTIVKRKILLRCYNGQETVRQVAESLGQSFDAVRKSVFRTRTQLATCVKRELNSEDLP